MFVPSTGPTWPIICRSAMPTPRFVSEPWLLRTQGRMLATEGNTPTEARKMAKYRTATPRQTASRTRPRCLVRSARYVVRMQHRKERKYGGAVRPWAWMEVKPMPVRMVGRKTGSDANETLHEKYISCGSQTLAI